jgi:MoaA/NifB/PqqE/SkfB family radical SAM enzyme
MSQLPVTSKSAAAVNYAWRGGRLLTGFVRKRPIHCIVQVSNRCNLTCGFCSFWERPAHPRDEMTVADFEVISAKLAEAGSMVVSLEGGEPLLRPDAAGIVRAFARYHHPILFTNGWRVTGPLAHDLWQAGLTEIGVSIDYATPELHDTHRGLKGTFAAAVKAVGILRDAAPHGSRQVTVMTVLMRDNFHELEALLKLSKEQGVSHQCTLVSTLGDGRSDPSCAMPEQGIGERLLELKAKYPHFITFSGYLEGVGNFLEGQVRTPCWAGERFLNVDHLGEVSPCIEKLHLRAGNLRRDPWSVIEQKLRSFEEVRGCSDCYTSCRGFVEEMSGTPRLRSWREFFGGFANVTESR